MKKGEVDIVKLASRNQGDDFWTDADPGESPQWDWVFEEILSHLHKEGLDLKLVNKED